MFGKITEISLRVAANLNYFIQLSRIILYMVRATFDVEEPHGDSYCSEEAQRRIWELHNVI